MNFIPENLSEYFKKCKPTENELNHHYWSYLLCFWTKGQVSFELIIWFDFMGSKLNMETIQSKLFLHHDGSDYCIRVLQIHLQQHYLKNWRLCGRARWPWLSEVLTRCKGPWEMKWLEDSATASLLRRLFPVTHPWEHLVPETPDSHRMTEQVMYTCRHKDVKSDSVCKKWSDRQRGTLLFVL